jgi:hypothetical protein
LDIGVWMSAGVLEHKIECAEDGKSPEVTWNTRRVPKDLEPGWTNRLFVACEGSWRGYFPLSGDVMWNPEDEAAPIALVFDSRGWTEVAPVPVARFRGWRAIAPAALGLLPDEPPGQATETNTSSSSLKKPTK